MTVNAPATGTQLYIFGRFHVREGAELAAIEALHEMLAPVRAEPGCLQINTYRSLRDPRFFYIHSIWNDQAAFDLHASLPHTLRFIESMEALADQPREVTRCHLLE